MNHENWEQDLRAHAQRVLAAIDLPSNTESEEFIMKNKKTKWGRILAAAVAAVCVLGMSCFAGYRYLNAREVAELLHEPSLAQYFDGNETESETVEDGRYRATLLGIVSGEEVDGLQNYSEAELHPDCTYVVASVERTDGSDMTMEDSIMITPLIQGFRPWQFNIAMLNGGYTQQIEDGVLYRIIECDNIEYFADRELYLGVVDQFFLNNQPFRFDETTGLISEDENYDGTNILFQLKLDPAKANPQKAKEYLESLENEEPEDEEPADETSGEATQKLIIQPDFSVVEVEDGETELQAAE